MNTAAVPFAVPPTWRHTPSPNHSRRQAAVNAIVLHADAASRIESSLDWVRRSESQVSYHVMIGRNGVVFMTVHPDRKAWHAGASQLDSAPNCNQYGIGVCLSNRNDGIERYPDVQVAAAVEVCARLCRHYSISVERIVSHAAVAVPAGRKTDPRGLDLAVFQERVRAALAVSG